MMNARASVLEDGYELQNLDNCCTDINANIIYEPVVARQQRARTYSGDILEETKYGYDTIHHVNEYTCIRIRIDQHHVNKNTGLIL